MRIYLDNNATTCVAPEVFEEPVSARMGYDKVQDHVRAGAEYIVSQDMSCLMHQKGCAERLGLPVKFLHIAQVLNGAAA